MGLTLSLSLSLSLSLLPLLVKCKPLLSVEIFCFWQFQMPLIAKKNIIFVECDFLIQFTSQVYSSIVPK
jgi:hypothetical protein